VTKSLLSRNAVILMDDIERSDEQAVVACWNRRFGIHCKAYQTPSGAYAVATLENSAVLS
jgi:nickel-dependent lactate racemase